MSRLLLGQEPRHTRVIAELEVVRQRKHLITVIEEYHQHEKDIMHLQPERVVSGVNIETGGRSRKIKTELNHQHERVRKNYQPETGRAISTKKVRTISLN